VGQFFLEITKEGCLTKKL